LWIRKVHNPAKILQENPMSTLNDKVNLSKDVLFHKAIDEAVLLNPANGKYFSLDDIGTRMWELMNIHGKLREVHQALLEEYQVEPQQLEKDLLSLTDQLAANELLQISES